MKRFGFGLGIGAMTVDGSPIVRPTKMVVFDGITKFFDLGALNLDSTISGSDKKFTVAGLFYLENTGGSSPVFLACEKVGTNQMRIIWDGVNGWLDFQFSTDGGVSYNCSYKPAVAFDLQGAWFQVVITYDDTLADHKGKIYFNDIAPTMSDPAGEDTIDSVADAVVRNSITDAPVLPFNGKKAWFGWFNNIKSAAVISSWYDGGLFRVPTSDMDAIKVFDAGALSDLTTGWKDQDGNNFGAFYNSVAGDLQTFP